jgi:hypothetical protein
MHIGAAYSKNAEPPIGGYQPNDKGISAAARELVMLGKTDAGRRKHIERALKIANLPPKVKAAAVEAELQNKRSALLEIATEKGLEAQLKKIEEILARPPRTRNRKTEPTPGEAELASPQSAIIKSDEAYSMLTRWWEVSPADAKTRFKTFIDGANPTQAA